MDKERKPNIFLISHFRLDGHVRSLAFSSDGRFLAGVEHYEPDAGSPYSFIRVFDMRRLGTYGMLEITRLFVPGQKIWSIAFGPSGSCLIGFDSGHIRIWDAPDWHEITLAQILPREKVVFSNDGHYLARTTEAYIPSGYEGIEGDSIPVVDLWDVIDRQPYVRLSPQREITDVAFSSDNKYVATLHNHLVKIWDAVSGNLISGIELYGGIQSVAFSPNGQIVAISTYAYDSDPTGEDSEWIGEDSTDIWRIVDGKRVKEIGSGGSVFFSPNGQYLALVTSKVRLSEVNEYLTTKEATFKTTALPKFSPDSKYLALAAEDQKVHLWESNSGREVFNLPLEAKARDIIYSPNGQYLVALCEDNAVLIWQIAEVESL